MNGSWDPLAAEDPSFVVAAGTVAAAVVDGHALLQGGLDDALIFPHLQTVPGRLQNDLMFHEKLLGF